MKVRLTVVGEHRDLRPVWPEGWAVPREGEGVTIGNVTLHVRTVVWILADPEFNDPFVYVVLGDR